VRPEHHVLLCELQLRFRTGRLPTQAWVDARSERYLAVRRARQVTPIGPVENLPVTHRDRTVLSMTYAGLTHDFAPKITTCP
jgi:hypothetical protein